ncbi:MAG: alpha/beta hydrolase [Pseudomonadota bacterium]
MAEFTASDGTRLSFDSHGDGAALICLSGLTRNRTDFDYVLPHLTGVRTIRLDYRGRGASAWADPASYTIPREAQDTIELMDHLGLRHAAIMGTSRGGLIAMVLAASAKGRLSGVLLNDIGPELKPEGLDVIKGYIGRNPAEKTYEEAADMRARLLPGFDGVPRARWEVEVRKHYTETPKGLVINYDPALRDAVLASGAQPMPNLWPMFDALASLPLAALRGANSNLLSPKTFAEMQTRRPDMIAAEVPDRGHVPFLDEPASLNVIHQFLDRVR